MGSTENFFSLTQYQEKAGEYIVKEKEDIVCGEKRVCVYLSFLGCDREKERLRGKIKKH